HQQGQPVFGGAAVRDQLASQEIGGTVQLGVGGLPAARPQRRAQGVQKSLLLEACRNRSLDSQVFEDPLHRFASRGRLPGCCLPLGVCSSGAKKGVWNSNITVPDTLLDRHSSGPSQIL